MSKRYITRKACTNYFTKEIKKYSQEILMMLNMRVLPTRAITLKEKMK